MIVGQAAQKTIPPTLRRCVSCSAPLLVRGTRARPPVRGARKHPHAGGHPSANDPTPIPGSDIWQLSAQQDATRQNAVSSAPTTSVTSPSAQESQAIATTSATGVPDNLPPASRLPVNVPHDQLGVIDNGRGQWAERLRTLLANPAIVVARELEMLNVLVGYEQANKYRIMDPQGNLLAYLVEEDLGIGRAIARQAFKTRRAFKATVLDPQGNVLLIIRRPFSWINSRIYACTPSEGNPTEPDKVIGEAQQEWHLWRRKYVQFVQRESDGEMVQFGSTDEGFLAWEFTVRNEQGEPIASISRNFSGIARELFTDTGEYVVRFEAVADQVAAALPPSVESSGTPLSAPSSLPSTSTTPSATSTSSPDSALTPVNDDKPGKVSSPDHNNDRSLTVLPSIPFDQRAVLLACAVSADFDYFTRDRGGAMGTGFGSGMLFQFPMGGGGGGTAPAEGGAAGAGAGTGAEGGVVGNEGTESDVGPAADNDVYGGEDRYGGWGGRGPSSSSSEPTDGGGWDEQVMRDPWNDSAEQQEQGGTWGWGDLFPGDGDDGGGGGDGDW